MEFLLSLWFRLANHYVLHTESYLSVFNSVQSLSHVQLFATPWIAAHQASLSITNSGSSPKLMSIESVMPSSHLILCLLPPIPPSIRVFQWVNSSLSVAIYKSKLSSNIFIVDLACVVFEWIPYFGDSCHFTFVPLTLSQIHILFKFENICTSINAQGWGLHFSQEFFFFFLPM